MLSRAIGLVALLVPTALATLAPGSYVVQNVNFPDWRISAGPGGGQPFGAEGGVVPTFLLPFPSAPVISNHIFTIDSTMTRIVNEASGQFCVVDLLTGGFGAQAGIGLILANSTTQVPPFVPLGNQAWQFIQASEGMVVLLEGTDLVWSQQAVGLGTQITLQPSNPADLRQQWTFIAHGPV
ncbi:hypothetical protein SISNIDRAFT_449951 [Sistotremastrum niveocremeum HHB9708]|uniref:Ricin B lectin domain-containing protein n=2 Tax=Sistotremastraceae TaxID=3402574 RepID=A0A164YS01_9AGAM|nr:hypothetical protein SISNIDRAFT_449951 [Sistotremastrum niveocremeum HHB9708]KZT41571.1 hypothetical protein SISSUDRAFT_1042648 [Sistotremastrum suecicum HHB10207 ss-3]